MKRSPYRIRQRMFLLYIVSLFALSVSLALMPVATGEKETSIFPLIAVGALFWIGLIATAGIAININKSRKASPAFSMAYPDLKQLGLIHFFQNKPAAVADVALFVSIASFIIIKIFSSNRILQFIVIALIVFSFGMHCMLNGINYIFIKYRTRREKVS